jgi:crotonobetainyl-CoA:carnitine CoA-transferase CaiB-like acyl-CoA transferase
MTTNGVSSPPSSRLLAGLKVADFSDFVASPLAAQVLADLGADVVKVEPPDGEAMRAAAYAVAARQAEKVLEAAFATAPAAAWTARLRALGLLAELIEPLDRDGFRRAVLDAPVNRQLGRVVSYPTAGWGRFEQIGPLRRCGPEDLGGPRLMLPGVGEHTVEILGELGFTLAEIDALLAAKVARQLEPGA